MSKCTTDQGNRLCAVQVMLIEVASWNLLQASWSRNDGHEKSQRNSKVALLSQLKELNNLCQPINNQRSSRRSQPKSIDSKKEQNKNLWWQ
jgi:hypothetical protein